MANNLIIRQLRPDQKEIRPWKFLVPVWSFPKGVVRRTKVGKC